MPAIPSFMLRALYQRESLRITGDGFQFEIRNDIAPVRLTGLLPLKVDGKAIPLVQCSYVHGGEELPATAVSAANPVPVDKGESVTVRVRETRVCLCGRHPGKTVGERPAQRPGPERNGHPPHQRRAARPGSGGPDKLKVPPLGSMSGNLAVALDPTPQF